MPLYILRNFRNKSMKIYYYLMVTIISSIISEPQNNFMTSSIVTIATIHVSQTVHFRASDVNSTKSNPYWLSTWFPTSLSILIWPCSAHLMAMDQIQFGWKTCLAQEMSHISKNAATMDGAHITVVITKTLVCRVQLQILLQVKMEWCVCGWRC